ncbi:MAG: endonuclease domain-containing protein [Burkholderiales bacterium]
MRGNSRPRRLRQTQTDAEAALWWRLRGRRLAGCKFRRQFPIGRYIVDFVCLEAQLVVELDGGQHAEQSAYDDCRTRFLASLGFEVRRYWNDDVLLRTHTVVADILSALGAPHPDPLPASGERERHS